MLVVGRLLLWTCLFLMCAPGDVWAGPPVAPTDPLPPQEEQTKFKLPPGFEIQLVAAEPDIQKPMNLAFDARGRLWVTHSIEYPWAAEDPEQARDGLTILDGIGPDGKATKVTKFADKLNIPIGVLPMPNGREAIVWSIPYIWKMTDTDDDGKADKREVLYGPFDFVDTHGDQNAFRLGNDGWVYACHGFRNSSKIKLKGEGPVVLEMNSGNTYRFKPDGSAIEQISWGQVNPFGMCIDSRGDLFTADCHSKPVTMILPGGYYDSFGKPDDGLGFAPITTSNDHGSTGIAGIVAYDAPQFPREYHGSMFVGNVVTNIVHRDTLEWRGSSPWVSTVEDFLTCSDWWFHPVDLQLGPDGALYVSDFYNSIIGHYEVDLKHPRRDRHRGRIWRIVYTGEGQEKTLPPSLPDLRSLSLPELLTRLSDRNITVRNLVAREVEERFGMESVSRLKGMLKPASQTTGNDTDGQAEARALALWLVWKAGQLDEELIKQVAGDPHPIVRNHLMRILGEMPGWSEVVAELVRRQLKDANPFVLRSAVNALARHADTSNLRPLVELWKVTPETDVQLIHATRVAIRNQLRPSSAVEGIANVNFDRDDLARVVDIALAVPGEAAAWFTFDYIRRHDVEKMVVESCLRHVARHVGIQRLDEVATYIQQKFSDDVSQQVSLFQSLLSGLTQRGGKLSGDTEIGRWAGRLATSLLDPQARRVARWENRPIPGGAAASAASPWGVTRRNSADGKAGAFFYDSIAKGEQLTGVLTSAPFEIPQKLSFWMCGHNGLPGSNPPPVNHVRLRLMKSGEIIAREIPPRNDVAQQYTWNLEKWAGQEAVLELVDADTGNAYAWLGVGRFEPEVVANPIENFAFVDSSLVTAIQIADQLQLKNLAEAILGLLRQRSTDLPVRILAASAGLSLDRTSAIPSLMTIVQNSEEPYALRTVAAQLLASVNTQPARLALAMALGTAPAPLQQPIALAMASSREGSEMLFSIISQGKASARLLQDKALLDRLNSVSIPNKEQRIQELTDGLPPADERLKQIVSKLVSNFATSDGAAQTGAAVFKKTCATCHRINSEGGKVGPQLDGVGNRGLDRLLEDILDPNRNVDAAFRAILVAKNDGVVVTGLKLREEGGALIVGDNQGKEVRVPLTEIDEARLTNLSPMPSNFAEQLNEADLRSLLAYLLQQRQSPTGP